LVEKLGTGERLVAKKILLTGMSEREIQGAYLEAELLKRLDHPNIVRYKDSYCESGFLIIVMENCEVGDLAYHVKMKNKQGEFFTEAEIMNWFVQICMALQYIHSLGVLHRDIKTSNIYLTSNNTVRLGDFGISKVLQGSEAAMTVVGTPYYMSPEVCEGKPYSYKSDAWSLGCVLYELCTLKHAFSADNLLGLVFKIVSGTAEPIPSRYSPQLRRIVASMLSKDANSRLSIQDVIRDPFVLPFMQGFVETNGQEMKRQLTHKKLSSPTKEPVKAVGNKLVQESPKERMARLKKEKADEEFEKMKRATRDAFTDNKM
jgi:NIMA (never in mitosis gene a)-related kinase